MQAEEALHRSANCLIVAVTTRGLVTIYREANTEGAVAEAFHVRFIPRATGGELNAAGTVAVGTFDDLDIALTIATVSCGVGETGWMPASQEDLARTVSGENAPDIEGRRINPHDKGDNGQQREEWRAGHA